MLCCCGWSDRGKNSALGYSNSTKKKLTWWACGQVWLRLNRKVK